MNVIQFGYWKSGNYWLWRLIEEIGKAAGVVRPSFVSQQRIHAVARDWKLSFAEQADVDMIRVRPGGIDYVIAPVFSLPIENIDAYASKAWHVWSHARADAGMRDVLARFDHAVYIIRDPRDALVSMGHYAMTPYYRRHGGARWKTAEEAIDGLLESFVRDWALHVCGWLRLANERPVYFVAFERLAHGFDREAEGLAARLGFAIDAEGRARTRASCAAESMRRISPDHVRRGTSGGWTGALSPNQVRRVLRLTAPALELAGYSLAGASVPVGHAVANETALRKAERRAVRLTAGEKARKLWRFLSR